MNSKKEIGRFLCFILRHKPEAAGITLDSHGWADVDDLIAGICRTGKQVSKDMLEEIVAEDDKQMYSFDRDHRRIRANQGHSIPVDVELEEKVPPEFLYHGTGEKYVDSIDRQGLIPKSRLYVHLSADVDTAVKVGERHGRPVVYRVRSKKMHEDGILFCLSVNGVWLVKSVAPEYLVKVGQ